MSPSSTKNLFITRPQKDFIFSKARNPGMFAGLGSGKSHAACVRLIFKIFDSPGISVSHYFPSYRLAKRRGVDVFKQNLDILGIKYTLNKSDLAFYLPKFNSMIYLESYHDPESIVSFEIAHSVIDELDVYGIEIARLIWQKISERTRQKCSGINTVACVTTPNQGVNGFCYEQWGDNRDGNHHYIKAGTASNKFLPPGYVEQITANYDPVMVEAFVYGGWVSFTSNKVYYAFDSKIYSTEREINENDTIIHIGIDFNIGGCVSIVCIICGANAYIVDEFVSHDTQEFITKLKVYEGKKVIVYPDASGDNRTANAPQSSLSMIRNAGYQVNAKSSNPPIRDRINAVNGMFSHSRLFVNPIKCQRLVNALESQGYTAKGEPEKFNDHPAIDDYCDALGYFIENKFPIVINMTKIPVKSVPTIQHWNTR